MGPPQPARLIELGEAAEQLLGRDGLTAKQTTFTTPELVCAIAGGIRHGATADNVLDAAEELATFPGVELVESERMPGRPARFTTRELLGVEREALELALTGREVGAPRALPGRVPIQERAVLTEEQRTLVRETCISRDRVVCAVGVAGSGKTTALRVLGSAYREASIPVLGTAPSGRAADELAIATGIRSSTLHRLLLDAQLEGGLPRRCVVIVDEAGMAETRILGPLLRLVDDAGGKAILVGDPSQLPAVGAGGLFTTLCDRLDAVGLSENHRQHDPTEREALAHLRSGDPEPYLAHAASAGRLHLEDDATSAKRRLLEDWWPAAERELVGTVMLAYRRDDVRDLNDAARELMLSAGRLGPEALLFGRREFRVGDRVICGQNDARCDVRNGTRGTVVDLELASEALILKTDAGNLRRINAHYVAGHVTHAYALTGHAAQGATFDRAFVLLRDEGPLREWGYVACSRARTQTRLYATGESLEGEQHGSLLTPRDPTARLANALERAGAEKLASVQTLPETSEVTRRARERCRRQREQALETAEQRLSAAQEQLRRLGRLGHRRQRAELRAEISHQRTALRLARRQLTESPVEQPELRPKRAARTRLQPEPSMPTRTRDRGRHLDLEL